MHLKTFFLAVTLAVDLANCLPNLDNLVKNKNLKCNSIGRFPDPVNCGSFYDCVPSDNGELVAHQKSCMGLAYNPELKNCLPIHMVQGCNPYATRSFNIEDPTLEHLCRNKDNQFLCSDCKTMVLCVDGKAYTDPCSNGTQCSMMNVFGGGVCYPDDPAECTCNKPDIFKQDFYDLSKFLSCGPEGSDPIVHSCPNGFVFNEERGSCCKENGSECTPSGASLNKEDCTKYSTFILTIGGWIQKEFTCKNNTMFNEDTGNCEDPCKWYSGNFTCQEEGRFANPSNCRQFFECILDPLNSDRFTQIEHECPKGYSWNQILKGGYCVPVGKSKEKCVPQKQKPNECKIPNEWCPVPTMELCSKDGGSCIRSVDHCDGTINLFSNSINDHCICCVSAKDCGKVEPPVNGFVNETGTMSGDSIMFGCEDGFALDGANETNCLFTGNWSKEVPQCKITKVGCDGLGAQMIGGQCLYFSPSTDGEKNWDGAVLACTTKGGSLAGPLADPQGVVDYAKKNSWYGHVGASDTAKEGTWRWLNGHEVDGSLPWCCKQPDQGTSENCLYVTSNGYHDQPCSTSRRYICELGGVSNQNIRSEEKTSAVDNIISNNTPAPDIMILSNTNIPACASPWIYAGNSTGCLLVIQQSMDWHSAQAYCNSMDGHLPLFDRESKHLDMMDYFQHSGLLNTRFWLGANDHTGSWLWLNGMPVTDGWMYTQSKVDQEEDMCLYTYSSGLHEPMISFCTHAVPNIICQKKEM